jgi:hypothetical protein
MLIIAGGILLAVAACVAFVGFVFLVLLIVARCQDDDDFLMKVLLAVAIAVAIGVGQFSPELAWLFVLACALFVGGVIVAAGVHAHGRNFPRLLWGKAGPWVAVPLLVSVYAACWLLMGGV